MFTGLIEGVGSVGWLRARPGTGGRIRIEHDLGGTPVETGESVSVDGACLTAVRTGEGWFEADLAAETLSRTTLAGRRAGDPVNLERSVPAGGRLGGHLVQGHVDGSGEVLRIVEAGEGREMAIRCPGSLRPFLIEKGSIAVDGVSLTLARPEGDRFTVALVPQTLRATTLGRRRTGDRVNLEADLVVRTVVTTLERWRLEEPGGSLEAALRREGYLGGGSADGS